VAAVTVCRGCGYAQTRSTIEGAVPVHHPNTGRHRVLIADDEERIREVVARILRGQDIAADTVSDGEQATAMIVSGHYDLLILDLLTPGPGPGLDGIETLREIMRRRPDQSVLVLSCLTDPESKIACLGLGADDYLAKPFHVGELVARVRARLRAAARPGAPYLRSGRLTLDVVRRVADSGPGPVALSSREFHLLWELMRQPGSVISKDDLLSRVWGKPTEAASNVVDVYVARLRSRLGTDLIETVRGQGYRIDVS
jgi:two-component system, OmpR family, copper resistance phosphate regulon response regulator CusR